MIVAAATGPAGISLLVLFALLEATVFPGPTEGMLIALVLARRERAWRLAAIATLASVAGGLIGYHIGDALFASVARPLLEGADLMSRADTVADFYRSNALLALCSSGYTPIPYMLYTMMAGASNVPLGVFIAGSMIGRALKYVPIAALAYVFGPAVYRVMRRVGWWPIVVLAVGVAVYVVFGLMT